MPRSVIAGAGQRLLGSEGEGGMEAERKGEQTPQWKILPTPLGSSLLSAYYVAARRHICFCFMAKSAFWRGFSALAPYTGVGPI